MESEMYCKNCPKSFREDFFKGKTALRCGQTGRTLVVFPDGHEEAITERMTAPKWCSEGRQEA